MSRQCSAARVPKLFGDPIAPYGCPDPHTLPRCCDWHHCYRRGIRFEICRKDDYDHAAEQLCAARDAFAATLAAAATARRQALLMSIHTRCTLWLKACPVSLRFYM